jgi:hypothetical protein
MDPALVSVLRTATELFEQELDVPPLVPRSELQNAVVSKGCFMAQTKPVWYHENCTSRNVRFLPNGQGRA